MVKKTSLYFLLLFLIYGCTLRMWEAELPVWTHWPTRSLIYNLASWQPTFALQANYSCEEAKWVRASPHFNLEAKAVRYAYVLLHVCAVLFRYLPKLTSPPLSLFPASWALCGLQFSSLWCISSRLLWADLKPFWMLWWLSAAEMERCSKGLMRVKPQVVKSYTLLNVWLSKPATCIMKITCEILLPAE